MLAGLCLGCGSLLELAAGSRLPRPLVVPAGLAVVILAAQFATLTDATAELSGPLVVALALAGLLLSPWWRPRPSPWAPAAAAGVFAVLAAPIVLSGRATFAGYIKLDDTATYLAMTDRVMEHGRSLAGLAPSTYEATLATTLAIGYPTGSLMPLGLGHQLLAYDSAWLFQPYLAFLAALLALALYAVLAPVLPSRPLRAGAAFVAAQPAILYGYALWGGIKELLGALLLALVGALVPWTLARERGPRAVLPLAAASATVVCVLSLPSAFWLVPPLLAAAVVVVRRPSRGLLVKTGAFVAAVAVLAVPAYVAAVEWLPRIGDFGKETNLGNLIGPLSGWQLFGIWPIGDFRIRPHHLAMPTYVLIALVILAALGGVWWAWRRRAWGLLVYVSTAVVGCLVFVGASSPWVGGKTIAMASPAVLAAALAGCGALQARGRAVEAAVVVVAIAGGVIWSNVDQYHDVWLAPRGQLHELETIGRDFAGDGPALMTTYEPYGARHFLRRLDPEGASELRRRFDYLTDGTMLDKGESTDIDRLRLDQVLVYRTLVLRRGPAASRPPSVYRLVWSGRYYEVWQRPQRRGRTVLQHLPLGGTSQAAAAAPCGAVEALPGHTVATATRPAAISLGTPPFPGTATFRVTAPRDAVYTAWIAGDWFGRASVSIDGRRVGDLREELNWPGLYSALGSTPLAAGEHDVTVRYSQGGWHPGSGGDPYAFGPVALSPVDAREPVTTVPAGRSSSLCGRPLDWVEGLR
ncbi:MAG TPA: hypothetical protein VKB10_09555 [Gaiellaceae bacterium]|nr:hypothetical protein [Gaiellaceae bacterium]